MIFTQAQSSSILYSGGEMSSRGRKCTKSDHRKLLTHMTYICTYMLQGNKGRLYEVNSIPHKMSRLQVSILDQFSSISTVDDSSYRLPPWLATLFRYPSKNALLSVTAAGEDARGVASAGEICTRASFWLWPSGWG